MPKARPAVRQPGPRQPRILNRFIDAFGQLHVIDETGADTVLALPAGMVIEDGKIGVNPQSGGSTFGVSNDWSGGTTEIRWSYTDDQNNNRSYVWVGLYGHTTGFRTYGDAYFNLYINGDWTWTGRVDVSGGWALLAARDAYVGHDAAGAGGATVGVTSGEVYGTSFNSVSGTQWHGFTNYVVLPYAPQNIKVRAGTVATTSFGVEYSRNSHDGVDQDEVQWATDAGFANVVWTDTAAAGYSNPLGKHALTPGTAHWVRVRSHTGRGWGPYSATVSQTTLPAVPPGMTVTPSPSGREATLNFTPPGGVSGVTRYNVEYRVKGTTTPVATGVDGANSMTVTGLTPGTVYEWRSSANIGTYTSPWTDSIAVPPGTWLAVQQPNPNVDPGDYFDGNTPDKPGIDYGWTGTPGLSTSQATGKNVTGWIANFTAPLAGVLHQAADAYAGENSARVLIQLDGSAAGQVNAGMDNTTGARAEVAPNTAYFGSVYINPSRSQRMRAELRWIDAAGVAAGGDALGADSVVPANVWTRLTVSGIAPANATLAVVRVIDVAGTGWAVWHGGDSFLLDAAMVSLTSLFPYFDGDTPDSSEYDYEWEGTPDASPSTRTPVTNANPFDPLDDPDCPPLPSPPRPPVVPADCIDEVGVWRRYWAQISGEVISDWLSVIPTITIQTASDAARQVRIRIYENPDNLSPDAFDATVWDSEQIVSYIPPKTLITLDGVSQRTWAEVDGGASRPADKLLYGTGGAPATWPVLSCGVPYLMSFDAPLDAAAGNLTLGLALTERMG